MCWTLCLKTRSRIVDFRIEFWATSHRITFWAENSLNSSDGLSWPKDTSEGIKAVNLIQFQQGVPFRHFLELYAAEEKCEIA